MHQQQHTAAIWTQLQAAGGGSSGSVIVKHRYEHQLHQVLRGLTLVQSNTTMTMTMLPKRRRVNETAPCPLLGLHS